MFSYRSAPKKFFVKGRNCKIDNLRLTPKQLSSIRCYCRVIANEDLIEPKVYNFTIIQRDKKTGQVVGGEDYQIKQQPRLAMHPQAEAVSMGDKYLLKATNVAEPAKYAWYDERGVQVAQGQEVTIQAERDKSYVVHVESQRDGTVNYAQVDVCGTQRFASLMPVPFGCELRAELEYPASSGTIVTITSVGMPSFSEEFNIKEGEKGITIFTSNYPKGVYLVSLTLNGQTIDARRIVHE